MPSGIGNLSVWLIIAIIAYNLRNGLMNMGDPVYQTFMLERIPQDVHALAISLNIICFQFGWFVMPQISGHLQVQFGEFGFVPIFIFVSIMYSLAALAEYIFFRDSIQSLPTSFSRSLRLLITRCSSRATKLQKS